MQINAPNIEKAWTPIYGVEIKKLEKFIGI